MTDHLAALSAARAHAEAAKARAQESFAVARRRFAPAALKQEAKEAVMDKALDGIVKARHYAKGHKAQVAGGIALGAAWLARRPLMALFRRLFVSRQQARQQATPAQDEV